MDGFTKFLLPFVSLWAAASAKCEWTNEKQDDFLNKVLIGSIVSGAVGLFIVVLASLPLCCAVMKGGAKYIACCGIPFGLAVALTPWFTSLLACGPVADDICEVCAVSDKPCIGDDHEDIYKGCQAVGVVVTYLQGYGVVGLLLGPTASILSCLILAGCCAMKDDGSERFVDAKPEEEKPAGNTSGLTV